MTKITLDPEDLEWVLKNCGLPYGGDIEVRSWECCDEGFQPCNMCRQEIPSMTPYFMALTNNERAGGHTFWFCHDREACRLRAAVR